MFWQTMIRGLSLVPKLRFGSQKMVAKAQSEPLCKSPHHWPLALAAYTSVDAFVFDETVSYEAVRNGHADRRVSLWQHAARAVRGPKYVQCQGRRVAQVSTLPEDPANCSHPRTLHAVRRAVTVLRGCRRRARRFPNGGHVATLDWQRRRRRHSVLSGRDYRSVR